MDLPPDDDGPDASDIASGPDAKAKPGRKKPAVKHAGKAGKSQVTAVKVPKKTGKATAGNSFMGGAAASSSAMTLPPDDDGDIDFQTSSISRPHAPGVNKNH